MKILPLFSLIASLILAQASFAENVSAAPVTGTTSPPVSEATPPAQPQLSDNPKMKAEGKRLAAVMEKLQKESDPEERRKLMSEAMCPQ
jgi:hypothetical protein